MSRNLIDSRIVLPITTLTAEDAPPHPLDAGVEDTAKDILDGPTNFIANVSNLASRNYSSELLRELHLHRGRKAGRRHGNEMLRRQSLALEVGTGYLQFGVRLANSELLLYYKDSELAVAGLWRQLADTSRWTLQGSYYGCDLPGTAADIKPIAPLPTEQPVTHNLSPAVTLGLTFAALARRVKDLRHPRVRQIDFEQPSLYPTQSESDFEIDETMLPRLKPKPAPSPHNPYAIIPSFTDSVTARSPVHMEPGAIGVLAPRRSFLGKEYRFRTDDGRDMVIEELGPEGGHPIFLLHGTPASRRGYLPESGYLHDIGVRLLSFDRPGYGDSTAQPGRTIIDGARDVYQIAKALCLPPFSIIGRSGGAPYALACAALPELKNHIQRVVALANPAPRTAEGMHFYHNMGTANARDAHLGHEEEAAELSRRAERIRQDPWEHLRYISQDFSEADWQVFRNPEAALRIAISQFLGLQDGAQGWIDDVRALHKPWGFTLDAVGLWGRGNIKLWGAGKDRFTPVHHTEWYASQISGADVHIEPDAGHFTAMHLKPIIDKYFTDLLEAHARYYGGRAREIPLPW